MRFWISNILYMCNMLNNNSTKKRRKEYSYIGIMFLSLTGIKLV